MRITRTGHDLLLIAKIGNLAGKKGSDIVAKGVTRQIETNQGCRKLILKCFLNSNSKN